jgi:hypothetical protein
MKKLIATIALGAFVFTSTLVTTSFAADTTAENTAETTAISAAQVGAAYIGLIVPVTAATALLIGAAASDSSAGHSGHSGHSGHE